MDLAAFDWTLYWFMFPVAILVATSAMLSGIGGAAIFAPIFLIIFPLLGPEYPLGSLAAATEEDDVAAWINNKALLYAVHIKEKDALAEE